MAVTVICWVRVAVAKVMLRLAAFWTGEIGGWHCRGLVAGGDSAHAVAAGVGKIEAVSALCAAQVVLTMAPAVQGARLWRLRRAARADRG